MNDGMAQKVSGFIFRFLFSLIFLVAGIGHLLNSSSIVKRLEAAPFAPVATALASADTLVFLSGVALFMGGLGLLAGFFTRLASWGLIGVLIPITLTVQTAGGETMGPLFKNIALLGGLIHFAFNGSKFYSLDAYFSGRTFRQFRPVMGLGSILLVTVSIVLAGTKGFIPLSLASSQSQNGNEARVAFLVREPEHLKTALMTSAQMMDGKTEVNARAATIVVCGKKGVKELKKGTSLAASLELADRKSIRVVACGLTLKKQGIDPNQLHKSVQVVPNGLVEMIRLKQDGYFSVDL